MIDKPPPPRKPNRRSGAPLEIPMGKLLLETDTFKGYRPGPKLCEFILPGAAEELGGMAHDNYEGNPIPRDLVELSDQAIIDWLMKRADAQVTIERIQNVAGQFKKMAAATSDEEDRELIELWVESLDAMCERTFPQEAVRELTWKNIRWLRQALHLPEADQGHSLL